MNYYDMIFKRKSFHVFKNVGVLTEGDLRGLEDFIKTVKPLDDSIRYAIKIVPQSETTVNRGAEYCILIYSEKKNDYLRNAGYIGQQIDLYCVEQNIGSLWVGMGTPDVKQVDGLDYVIMLVVAKKDQSEFRKDMFKAKRKTLEEIWHGDSLGVGDIVRFTPSACNSQPWFVESDGSALTVYRDKNAEQCGIAPDKMHYFNKIDMGIFLFILEVCLAHEGYSFTRTEFPDDDSAGNILTAKYVLCKN